MKVVNRYLHEDKESIYTLQKHRKNGSSLYENSTIITGDAQRFDIKWRYLNLSTKGSVYNIARELQDY
jgi:hypothetical protein